MDIAYFRCIQGIVLAAPKNGNEFRDLLYTALNHSGPVGIRYPKFSSIEFDEVGQSNLLPIGSWDVEKKGNDTVIIRLLGAHKLYNVNTWHKWKKLFKNVSLW